MYCLRSCNTGNLAEHLRALDDVKDPNLCKGEPSIQNALTLGRASLSHVPAHGSKELIFVMAALTSRDPGDIQSTVAKVHADKIRVSAVGLAAEVQLCRNICKETGGRSSQHIRCISFIFEIIFHPKFAGTYRVALDQDHAKDCLWEMIPPPPLTADNSSTDLILFGFPLRSHQKFASLCAW